MKNELKGMTWKQPDVHVYPHYVSTNGNKRYLGKVLSDWLLSLVRMMHHMSARVLS